MKSFLFGRQKFGFFFVAIAIAILVLSSVATSRIIRDIAKVERFKMSLLAEATKRMVEAEPDQNVSFELHIIEGNEDIPVIIIDEDDNLLSYRNIDILEKKPQLSSKIVAKMKSRHEPIVIEYESGIRQYIYYDDSFLKLNIIYFALVQALAVIVFVAVFAYIFIMRKRAEQNRVWVGLSRETAHQLGTPITSLMAWVEVLKEENLNPMYIDEMSKDVNRLRVIAERFSKIGSVPELKIENLTGVLHQSVEYLRKRVSNRIVITCDTAGQMFVPLNVPLFEWVVENLCKNAVDAMEGEGRISILAEMTEGKAVIDVSDTGKGIAKSDFSTVFTPGYTTKKRGWGLGLSLVKRIVEEYHGGKIFVKSSEIGKGTTFRIVLPLQNTKKNKISFILKI
ncbi:MAG: HAMP domain-containing histidine kinase [Bacteroidales bacterium]|nr:HAMP domain-containing histidine kinase [Bacteroidales bacterium]MBR6311138.1 HAMP domain-containing histidine kinase [Paludibacteraceae bacterium]